MRRPFGRRALLLGTGGVLGGMTGCPGETGKASNDPDCEAKKARVEHHCAVADGEVVPERSEPELILCPDEFGPRSLQSHPGRQWAERGGRGRDPERDPRPHRRAIHPSSRSAAPVRRAGPWAEANSVEIAYAPTNSSWLNRIEAQFTALCCFTLDGTDRTSHKKQRSMIRRYVIRRNKHAADERLRKVVDRANVAWAALAASRLQGPPDQQEMLPPPTSVPRTPTKFLYRLIRSLRSSGF
ncbi:hypothetical protein ACFV8T_34235 [Streptomyces sp. NPDC059832]|uniref:hypothetical protein n=1 Tax=Streptomyces sp. NPDC059832 TaxID=3346966 RepID=UPI00365A9D65